MCGVLLHVEKVWALWLLCAAEPLWEEKVQQLSWCNVSGRINVWVLIALPVETKVQLYFLHSDLMDRLVDEAEGLAVDSSSSVCSGAGGGGRLEATTDQQLSLLNSITASDLTG